MRLLVIGDFQGNFSRKLVKKIKQEDFDAIIGVGDYGGISDWRPWVIKNLRDSKAGKPYLTAEQYFGKKKFSRLAKKDNRVTMDVLRKLTSFGKPVISIFGNGDGEWYNYKHLSGYSPVTKGKRKFLEKLRLFKDVTYWQTKFRDMSFIGFGGYMDIDAYFDKKVFKNSEDKTRFKLRIERRIKSKLNLFSRLRRFQKNKNLIFVFHYPPKGAFDIIRDRKDNPLNGKSAGIGFFTEAIRKYRPLLVLCGHMHEYRGAKKIGETLVVNPGDAEKDKYAIVDVADRKIKVNFS